MDSADRIRFSRRLAGLSQAKLAAMVGVQRSAVGHWESANGKRPSVAHLDALARATGVHFEWLATGRGEPRVSDQIHRDSIAAVDGVLLEDVIELRLVRAFRDMPYRARQSLLDLAELVASQRTGRRQAPHAGPPAARLGSSA